jgi:hypothetical protein
VSNLESLGRLIDAALGRWGLGDMEVFMSISDRWSEIVGQRWAEFAVPTLLRNGVLTVETSAAAASVLRYSVGDLLLRLDEEVGKGTVGEIHLSVIGRGRRTD